jgi:hypothetical protein
MTIKILVTPLAAIDLDDIVLYLTSSNPDIALRFFDDVRKANILPFCDINLRIHSKTVNSQRKRHLICERTTRKPRTEQGF